MRVDTVLGCQVVLRPVSVSVREQLVVLFRPRLLYLLFRQLCCSLRYPLTSYKVREKEYVMRMQTFWTNCLFKHLPRCCSHGYAQYAESCRNCTHFRHSVQKTLLGSTAPRSKSERRVAARCSAFRRRESGDVENLPEFRSSLNEGDGVF
jgi:hypothetical protein